MDSSSVTIGENNAAYIPQRMLYYSKTRPENFVSNKYWHNLNGEITVWEWSEKNSSVKGLSQGV